MRQTVDAYEAALPAGAWPNWILGNHDQPRIASRAGKAQARVAQMLLLTLRGTPTCYYGDEIGMVNVDIPPDRLRDTAGYAPAKPEAIRFSRDAERTPMQWDATSGAGFCAAGVAPWLPIGDNQKVNVAAQDKDPHSLLSLFRRLTTLCRETPALSVGSYRSLDVGAAPAVAYERWHAGVRLLIALNFSAEPRVLDLSSAADQGEVRGTRTLNPLIKIINRLSVLLRVLPPMPARCLPGGRYSGQGRLHRQRLRAAQDQYRE